MIVNNTPLEHYPDFGLWVKREDLCCPFPGPPFSKTRGVFAHIEARPEKNIGVLDSFHSQAGHAVATACAKLGKRAINYYPKFKKDRGIQPQQKIAQELGASLVPLQATASWALYHEAKKDLRECYPDSYMMPNALKLPETVSETAAEVARTVWPGGIDNVLIAVSSGTIAAGVIRGLLDNMPKHGIDNVILHLGYNRNPTVVLEYIKRHVARPNFNELKYHIVNEGYAYSDKAKTDNPPPFPCNPYYDLKLFGWWNKTGRATWGEALLWNIG